VVAARVHAHAHGAATSMDREAGIASVERPSCAVVTIASATSRASPPGVSARRALGLRDDRDLHPRSGEPARGLRQGPPGASSGAHRGSIGPSSPPTC
jgi:hypothetical protein